MQGKRKSPPKFERLKPKHLIITKSAFKYRFKI